MNMYNAARKKLQAELQARNLDAYIALTRPNVQYFSGFHSAFLAESWRMLGTDMLVVPADPEKPPALIVSDYVAVDARRESDVEDIRCYGMWTECRELALVSARAEETPGERRIIRPEQYRPEEIFALLTDIMEDRGLAQSRIATDLEIMQKSNYDRFRSTFPNCQFFDAMDIVYGLRAIKYPEEIEILRTATQFTESGIQMAVDLLADGHSNAHLRANFEAGISQAILKSNENPYYYQGCWMFNHIGLGDTNRIKRGDIVKFDCGVWLNGYSSDMARVVSYGPPSDIQRRIHDGLLEGFDRAREKMIPGNTMRDVYIAANSAIRGRGLPNYSRGHFGHSLGMDELIEEPPFIGDNQTVLQPGMVLCLETPYYPPDVGGFNIEDVLLITENGPESFNQLNHNMRVI